MRQSKPQACPSDFGCATDPVAMATFVSRARTTTVAKSRVTVRRPRSPRPSGRVRPAHDPLATGLDRHAGADIKYVITGCPSWTLIEPCASRRSLILGGRWKTFETYDWPHKHREGLIGAPAKSRRRRTLIITALALATHCGPRALPHCDEAFHAQPSSDGSVARAV